MPSTRRLLKKTFLTTALVAVLLVAAAAGFAIYFGRVELPRHREQIAHRISQAIEANVTIDAVSLSWDWHGPIVRLDGIHVDRGAGAQTDLYIPSLGLRFSLMELLSGQRLPSDVIIHKPHFQLTADIRNWQHPILLRSTNPDQFQLSQLSAIRDVVNTVSIKNARIDVKLITRKGPRHVRLKPLNATIRNQGDSLTFKVTTQADAWLDTISLTARLNGPLSNIDNARVTLDIQDLSLPRLLHKLAPGQVPEELAGGTTSLHAEAVWPSGQLGHVAARLHVQALRRGPQHAVTLLPTFDAQLRAQPDANRSGVINVSLESLTSASPALDPIRASARIDTRQSTATLRARNIAASLLKPLVRQLLPELKSAQLSGTIKAVDVTLAPGKPAQVAVAFQQLGITTPRFATGHYSGHYYRNGDHNVIGFTGAGGEVRHVRYVQGALPITDLEGQLAWQTTSGALQLNATDLRLVSGASTMTLGGSLTLPDQGSPMADLTTHLTTPDCSVLLAHIPQGEDMPFNRLRDWLPRAIDACDVTVEGYLRGPLNQMFVDTGKHLGMTISGSGFAMEYKPGWPRLTQATGTVRLRGDTMNIDIDGGRMLGVAVGPVKIHVEDVREPVLFLDGVVHDGAASKMLSFLAKSPLRDRFGKLVEALDVGGKAGLDLHMRLPLKDNLGELKVSGVIHAKDNSIGLAALPAPIKSVKGDLHFSQDGLRAQNLHGTLMGVALTTRITPASANRIDIVARGNVSLPGNKALLAEYVPENWLNFAHGTTQVKARLQVDTGGDVSDLSLHSNLQGLALTLPKPLHKTMGSKTSFDLTIKNNGRVSLHYGHDVDVEMNFDHHKLRQAVVNFGATTANAVLPTSGFRLAGHIEKLPMGAWMNALQKLDEDTDNTKSSAKKDGSLPFTGANVSVGTLRAGHRVLHSVLINAKQLATADGWKIVVSGPDAKGKATWQPATDGRSTLRAHFSRMHIRTAAPSSKSTGNAGSTPTASSKTTLVDIDPALLPTMNITIDHLQVGEAQFGTAHIAATAIDEGWRLQEASLSGGELTLKADGRWRRHVGLTQAHLNISIQGQGVAALTRALGFAPALHAKHVSIKGALSITPNDHGLSPAALNGTLSLTLKDGVIKSIDPGAGRLLGLLNLYVLPRRLMFDFSDVVGKGLVFSKISGDFKIISGDAFTNNLVIQTPSSQINIVGRIGLAARDYDQTVTIIPKIGSSLTLAGAVLGGPIVGVAVFALQELLNTPLENASSITYQLKGSWGNPAIVNPRAKD